MIFGMVTGVSYSGQRLQFVEEIPEHDCQLDIKDVVEQVLFGDGFPSRSRRCLAFIQRAFLLSRKHPYTRVTFKSSNSFSQEIMRHRMVAPTTIHPYSEFRSYWEAVLSFYYIVYLCAVPAFISFKSHHSKEVFEGHPAFVRDHYLKFFILLFGYVEIFVEFFTGYVSSDGMDFVLEKSRIAKHYLKTFFVIDFVSSFPYGFVFLNLGVISEKNVWVEYLAALKLIRIISLVSYYNQVMQRFKVGYFLRKIFAIIVFLLVYFHWVSCLLLMASMTGMEFRLVHDMDHQLKESQKPVQQQTWYVKAHLSDKYAHVVWRVSLMRGMCYTVGITAPVSISQIIDIVPKIICSLLGIAITVVACVHVVVTTRKVEAGRLMFEELQTQLREYLRFKKVPRALNRRISQYFRFCYERSFYKEPVILSFVSGQLRQDVLLHKSRRLLETVEIFAKLPPLLAVRLVSCMKEQVALRNEVVVTAGTAEDRMHYILNGTVAVYSQQGTELLHLYEGDHFGEAALVANDVTWVLSVVAVEPTRMWTLSRDAFKHALAPDKAYLQRVEQVARARHGLLSGQATPDFGAPMMQLVQHLRRQHRAALQQRRARARTESHFTSFAEHEQPRHRGSEPFPRTRRRAQMDAQSPTASPARGAARRPTRPN